MKLSSGRLDAIDGMRGLAALAVAVLHFQNLFGFPDYPLKWGELPVDLFFILSGYIISYKYADGLASRTVSATTFLIHRVSRMWPLHVFALLLLLAEEGIAIWLHRDNFRVLAATDTSWAAFLNVLLLHCTGIYTFPNFNKPSWSISSELVINVAWMLLVLRNRWNPRVAIATVIVGTAYVLSLSHTFNICAPCNGYPGVNTGLVKTALGFALGCLIFWQWRAGYRLRNGSVVAGLATLLLIAVLGFYPVVEPFYADFIVVLLLFPVLLLVALDEDNFLSRFLSSFPLRWLGRISFSIYLLHLPIANAMTYLLLFGAYPSTPWAGILFVSLVLILSILSFFTIEKGGIWVMRKMMATRRAA